MKKIFNKVLLSIMLIMLLGMFTVSIGAGCSSEKYTITFIVEGQETQIEYVKEALPDYGLTPYKEPYGNEEYEFIGWEPKIKLVSEDATYTAQFEPKIRLYSVNVTKNVDGGIISGVGKIYELNDTANITATAKAGYTFDGFYNEQNQLITSNSTYTISNINNDVNLNARFTLITKTIIYHSELPSENPNPTTYSILDGDIEISGLTHRGYVFKGWFDNEQGTGGAITAIDSALLVDYNLYAVWELQNYTITYDLQGGDVSGINPTSYNVTTPTFTLINPTKDGSQFVGWQGTETEGKLSVTIETGSIGDREYVALWEATKLYFTLNVDGEVLDGAGFSINKGESATLPVINSSQYGMNGYSVSQWYSDINYSVPYDFSSIPTSDTVLYGKFDTYVVNTGFAKYYEKFSSAKTTSILTINSEEELAAWMDYVIFTNLRDKIKINYKNSGWSGFSTAIQSDAVLDLMQYQESVSYALSQTGNYGSVYITSDKRDTEATLTADSNKQHIYSQLDNPYTLQVVNARSSDFDDFNVNKVSKTISVYTSSQLAYALELGFKPICEVGSPAEKVYNKAKQVLRSIIDESFSDTEKALAIFEWLVYNVEYDNYAVSSQEIITGTNWISYDSWFPEGVFNNGVAVCDGIAKAFIIMAGLENIPAIRAIGNSHAWNKVYLEGEWYGVDATHGSLQVNGSYEVSSYSEFLFTDEYKVSKGFTATNYLDFSADNLFDYFDFISFGAQNSEFDLYVEDNEELKDIFNYVKNYEYSSSYLIITVALKSTVNVSVAKTYAQTQSGLQISHTLPLTDSNNNSVYVFMIS